MSRRLIGLVHRNIWQRLPRNLRRSLLFAVLRRLAPLPSANFDDRGPIVVAGAFRTMSGLGESARLCYRALVAAGFDVLAVDLTEQLMQPVDLDFPLAEGTAPQGPGTLVLHVNPPVLPMALTALGRGAIREKRIVGYWAWELPAVAPDWAADFRFVHEIWTTSAFTATALAQATSRPIHVVHHPISLGPSPAPASAPYPFTVLCIFNMASSMARKNPLAAIAAFKRALGDRADARMIVKVSNAEVYPEGLKQLRAAASDVPSITILDRLADAAGMERLYASAHLVISLHRSEGFGLVIAEAMLRAIPVIATDWSGSRDFFDARFGFPVPAELISAKDPQATYDFPDTVWADPDISAATDAMVRLYRDPDLRARLGQAARLFALSAFSAEAYGQRVAALLGDARSSIGNDVTS